MPIIRPSSDLRNKDNYMLYNELEKGINSLEGGEKYSEEEVYEELDKI